MNKLSASGGKDSIEDSVFINNGQGDSNMNTKTGDERKQGGDNGKNQAGTHQTGRPHRPGAPKGKKGKAMKKKPISGSRGPEVDGAVVNPVSDAEPGQLNQFDGCEWGIACVRDPKREAMDDETLDFLLTVVDDLPEEWHGSKSRDTEITQEGSMQKDQHEGREEDMANEDDCTPDATCQTAEEEDGCDVYQNVAVQNWDYPQAKLLRILDATNERAFVYTEAGGLHELSPDYEPADVWAVLKTGPGFTGRAIKTFVRWCCHQVMCAPLLDGSLHLLIAIPADLWRRTEPYWMAALYQMFYHHLNPRFATLVAPHLCLVITGSKNAGTKPVLGSPNKMPVFEMRQVMSEGDDYFPYYEWSRAVAEWRAHHEAAAKPSSESDVQ